MESGVRVFGHRGTRGEGNPPENSLAAFQAAIEQGAHGIELDVFLTKDKHVVSFHDERLERMTGIKGNITRKTLAGLKPLRLQDTQEAIPTLAQVLERVEQCHSGIPRDFTVNVEIKGKRIADRVAAEIKKHIAGGWGEANFLVSSFNMRALREMRDRLPGVPRGLLFAGPRPLPKKPWDISVADLRKMLAKTKDIGAQNVHITLPSLMARGGQAVRIIRDAGLRPMAWTFNERCPCPKGKTTMQARREAAFLIEHGVGLITDFPKERLETFALILT